MNRKDKRAERSKNNSKSRLRLLEGGQPGKPLVSRKAMQAAIEADSQISSVERFSQAVVALCQMFEQEEESLPESQRCSGTDKLAVLLRVSCNAAIKLGVDSDQLLRGMSMVYDEQERQLAEEK